MDRSTRAAHRLLERHQGVAQPQVVKLVGLEWDLLPGVYAPNLTQSAALYAEWLPFPVGGSLCEVGSGCGYLAVLAALRGCAAVTATDVSEQAVRNTLGNARRHGVADRVRVLGGDMFAPLGRDDRFDVVFWNSNFVEAETTGDVTGDLARAFFDPGMTAHEAYFAGAADHLAPGGRLLLGFSDLGDLDRVADVAGRHGWSHRELRVAPCESPEGTITYQLLEFLRR